MSWLSSFFLLKNSLEDSEEVWPRSWVCFPCIEPLFKNFKHKSWSILADKIFFLIILLFAYGSRDLRAKFYMVHWKYGLQTKLKLSTKQRHRRTKSFSVVSTICPRSSDTFYIVTYRKWVTTSCTDNTFLI